MEEMPIQLLLTVILFGFTLSVGFNAWDYARLNEEKLACYDSINTFLIKSQLVISEAPMSREKLDLIVKGKSELYLLNEEINNSQVGLIKAEFADGSHYLQVLPVPFVEERIFKSGEYSLSLIHIKNSHGDFLGVTIDAG